LESLGGRIHLWSQTIAVYGQSAKLGSHACNPS
jgi:hypothetical protein